MISRKVLYGVFFVVFLIAYMGAGALELIVDYLWYDTLGYDQIFETILMAKLGIGLAAGIPASAFLFLNAFFALRYVGEPAKYLPPEIVMTPVGQLLTQKLVMRTAFGISLLIGLVVGTSAAAGWEEIMLFFHGNNFGVVDPIFQRDAGFYIFNLPLLDKVQSYFWSLGILSLLVIGLIYFLQLQSHGTTARGLSILGLLGAPVRLHLSLLGGFLLLVMGWGFFLDRYELMHTVGGLFTGPGYSDINGTLPVLALKVAVTLVAAGILVFSLVRQQVRFLLGGVVLLAVVFIGGNIYTTILQRFIVSPNELEKERPFLNYHIEATNKAFALDKVVERSLDENTDLNAIDIERNRATVNNIRLWDHEPLLETFAQIQEIRTYYEFVSVDNDRYFFDGELRQTMLSPRELSTASLPSRTWVNERLTFTHGYGVTMGPVNQVNEQGLPVLYVQDLPPKTTIDTLKITRPEIYYGEVVQDYVFVKTKQQEFNYPEGDANIFTTYQGKGGISLDGALNRLLFAGYLRDVKVLLAEDFTPETRVLLHRNIKNRVRKIAPFFRYDQDPYMVINKGRLVWILDAYTLSRRYPYAEAVSELGNYMRNPVKVVVDAYNGDVTFYLKETNDPIANAIDGIMRC